MTGTTRSDWSVFGRRCAPQKTHSELLGLVQGVLADGVVVEAEAAFLQRWITEHESVSGTWPANVLFARIAVMLADGVLDADEQRELMGTMLQFVEARQVATVSYSPVEVLMQPSTATVDSPFDDPVPEIIHEGRAFVATGDFACAARRNVEARICQLGGTLVSNVSKKVHYVVVGSLGSDQWCGGNYGTKIERAIELRREGVGVRLVREKHWYEAASRA
jgi:NAD-dependent DNA ligase